MVFVISLDLQNLMAQFPMPKNTRAVQSCVGAALMPGDPFALTPVCLHQLLDIGFTAESHKNECGHLIFLYMMQDN
jgi:hypothetical protein